MFGGRVDKATKHRVISFETATRPQDYKKRDNTPYEEMVKKYGLANISSKFSTRELKTKPIESYMRSIGWNKGDYYTFIGIRVDEFDRMDSSKDEKKYIYPLVAEKPFTKQHVNFWWSQMSFRLELKGWEGNCVTCYKKSIPKLIQIMIDDAWKFEFDEYLEWKYGYYIPESRIKALVKKLKPLPSLPIKLFRNKKSVQDIREMAKKRRKRIKDDSRNYNFQTRLMEDDESCEVYTECKK
jgi:hypothetical protein